MPQYCDSKKLERFWFNWIVARATPQLEIYRPQGLLWTKIVGRVTNGEKLVTKYGRALHNPSDPFRRHCLAIPGNPIWFSTVDGEPSTMLPCTDIITHDFNTSTSTIEQLKSLGYAQELPINISWECMLTDIYNMCNGIGMKFNFSTEDERLDLIHEALQQVASKLLRNKLTYTPGRAPVFNLLTTTIHRIMFSILNKNTRIRKNQIKLAEEYINGRLQTAYIV